MPRPLTHATSLGLALVLLLAPTRASAQISVLPKVGSTGVGGDIALALTDRLAIRGGVGWFPIEFDDLEIESNSFEGQPPDFMATVGLDLTVAGPLRLSGGLLYRSGDFELFRAVGPSSPVIIDGTSYDQSGTVTVGWETRSTAPFVAVGLGGTAGSGVGLFLDLGVAFTGDPDIVGELTGELEALVPDARFDSELAAIDADIPSYAEYWPFLQLGVKIGVGN